LTLCCEQASVGARQEVALEYLEESLVRRQR
jgi:hypothetical protein